MTKLSLKKHSSSTKQALKALLVDTSDARGALLNKALRDNDYHIAEHIHDISALVYAVERHQPDFLIMGMDLPDQRVLDALIELKHSHPLPVIVFAEHDTPQIIEQVVKVGISAFIVDDIQAQRFPSIINVAIARFRAQQGLLEELEATKTKLAERKILEKAKGLLMKQKGLTEDEAYSSLRKMAMDKGQPIVAVAENIIDVFQLLETG